MKNQTRTTDDVLRLIAMLICAMPVATLCLMYVMTMTLAKVGVQPPDIKDAALTLKDVALVTIGNAAIFAFSKGASAINQLRQEIAEQASSVKPEKEGPHEENVTLTNTTKEN